MTDSEVLLTGATLIDGTGSGAERGVEVLVRGDRIERVAPAGTTLGETTDAPRGLRVIDLTDQFLIPGLIDCHVHANTFPDRSAMDAVTAPLSEITLRMVPVLQTMLHSGVTTARDLAGADHGVRTCIEEGIIEGPRLQVALRILSVTGGHGDWRSLSGIDLAGAAGGGQVADGVDGFIKAVRDIAREGGDWVKVAASGGMGSPRSDPNNGGLRPEELRAVVSEAERLGLVGVAAHAQGTRGIRDAVAAGVRSIEHGYGIDLDTIEKMGEQGTWLVPTLTTLLRPIVEDPHRPWVARRRREWQERTRTNLAAAFEAGIRVAVGTDAGIVGHDAALHELGHLVDLGFSPMDALLAGTSQAAGLLDIADEVGTIAEGFRADLVALKVDPLADPHKTPGSAGFVMTGGRVAISEPSLG